MPVRTTPRRQIDAERRRGAAHLDVLRAGERVLDQKVRALVEREITELDDGGQATPRSS
jgi:hypothetical protein